METGCDFLPYYTFGNNSSAISKVILNKNLDYNTDTTFSPFYNIEGSLTEVIIGDYVTSMKTRMFYNCSSITNVTIGSNDNNPEPIFFESNVFSGCSSFESTTINKNFIYSGISSPFSGRDFLSNVVISNNVTVIGVNAFYFCQSLSYMECLNLRYILSLFMSFYPSQTFLRLSQTATMRYWNGTRWKVNI